MANDDASPIDFNKVAIHTNIVDRTNVLHLSMVLQKLIKECDAIAIDTEFTGLGTDVYASAKASETQKVMRPGMEENLDERYESYSRVVRRHALVSLGLTLFKKMSPSPVTESVKNDVDAPAKKKSKKSKKSKKEKSPSDVPEGEGDKCMASKPEIPRYRASNFELILFCQTSHTVSPSSLAFLVQNGFDLNRQVKKGIPYLPGTQGMSLETNNKAVSSRLQSDLQKYNRVLREIIMELLSSKAALVVHNGLLDLMFIYHSFYADLPKNFSTFLVDVADWAECGGLYDTKCLSEYVTRDGASYLSFLFNKSLREQAVLHHLLKDKTPLPLRSFSVVMQPRIQLGVTPEEPKESPLPVPTAPDAISKLIETLAGDDNASIPLEAIFCFNYMFHGHCKDNQYSSSLTSAAPSCPKSHDLLRFLDASLLLAKKKFCNASNPAKIQFNPPPFLLDFFKNSHPSFYKQILETAAKHLPSSYSEPQVNSSHSAQYDSFMTGYVFLHFLNHPDSNVQINQGHSPSPGSLSALLALTQPASTNQKSYRNHLYLMGKKNSLLVAKSAFSKCSEAHRKLWHLEAIPN